MKRKTFHYEPIFKKQRHKCKNKLKYSALFIEINLHSQEKMLFLRWKLFSRKAFFRKCAWLRQTFQIQTQINFFQFFSSTKQKNLQIFNISKQNDKKIYLLPFYSSLFSTHKNMKTLYSKLNVRKDHFISSIPILKEKFEGEFWGRIFKMKSLMPVRLDTCKGLWKASVGKHF